MPMRPEKETSTGTTDASAAGSATEAAHTRDHISFLVGSAVRVDIFRTLREGTYRPSELAAECGCARETAQRTVGAFVERGWAEKVSTAEGYRLTPAGELLAQGYEEFEARAEATIRCRKLLRNLRGVDVVSALEYETLTSLTHAESTAESPHAPLNRFLSVVDDRPVDEFYGITPIVSQIFNRAADRAIGPESHVELVVDENVLQASMEEYPRDFERAAELPGLELYVAAEPLEFGLMTVDDHAYLGAYDDDGNLVASVDGTDDAFVTWADRTFSRIRERASRQEL
ncbi:helix-turn-helix transcriptional regulator [Halobellus ordinarius]|uniref:helix-turn-helix transcriptional regulator n=1 Tax=Halobellus ordinarius TaxID=3075120 RepID=UPI0028808432|nr:hypothetical protein [Halobellus sp. ZY16]